MKKPPENYDLEPDSPNLEPDEENIFDDTTTEMVLVTEEDQPLPPATRAPWGAHSKEFVILRRREVLAMYRRGTTTGEMVTLLAKDFDEPSHQVIAKDIKYLKKALVQKATDMFGDQRIAVADFVNKSLDIRDRAIEQNDLRLAHQIDKDLLKFVGVNLDAVDLKVKLNEGEGKDNTPRTFGQLMAQIRVDKGLTKVDANEF